MALSNLTTESVHLDSFARDILTGLQSEPKKLSSKYFYDERGDELFQQIMHMPEYYLTDSEYEILDTKKEQILSAFGEEEFDLIELGAGDGLKTKLLLSYFLNQSVNFRYRPVDISANALKQLEEDLRNRWPQLAISPRQGDYFKVLSDLKSTSTSREVVLFLGANIGNYTPEEAKHFLQNLNRNLSPGDQVLIGFDLKKDPAVILNAYNDPAGITAAFNLNLLRRINRELDADFDLDQFSHWESYDPSTGATKSFIVSRKSQTVQLGALQTTIRFDAWEAIAVELSQKYSLREIEALAEKTGFKVVQHLFDRRNYFVDTIWEV